MKPRTGEVEKETKMECRRADVTWGKADIKSEAVFIILVNANILVH